MVTKGMTVVWPRMSIVSLVNAIVIALISSASSWTATKGITHVLLFDAIFAIVSLAPLITRNRLGGSSHSGMQRSQVTHHLFVLIGLISVDGLRMLTQIV